MKKYEEKVDRGLLREKINQLELILHGLNDDSDRYWNIRAEQRSYERMLEHMIEREVGA